MTTSSVNGHNGAAQHESTIQRSAQSDERLHQLARTNGLVGEHPTWMRAIQQLQRFAKSRETVLLCGATGTGKELFARALDHEMGDKGEFVGVNCAALMGDTLYGQLFGYKSGSFTGATRSHKGFFSVAENGTLLLDEIHLLSLAAQGVLLRAIDQGVIQPLGSDQQMSIKSVRLIVATNADLLSLVHQGLFREDLYYRLKVLQIDLPLLSDRGEDVVLLAQHFLKSLLKRQSPGEIAISEHCRELFRSHSWPGNVRELKNMMTHVAVCDPEMTCLTKDHLLETMQKMSYVSVQDDEIIEFSDGAIRLSGLVNLDKAVTILENNLIRKAMGRAKGNQSKAAELLGISRNTLFKKLHNFNTE